MTKSRWTRQLVNKVFCLAWLALALIAAAPQPTKADDGQHDCSCCRRQPCCCQFGNPQSIGRPAIPSNTRHYFGYYVGGGTLFRGQPRQLNEGTWGWDYGGLFNRTRVVLDWSHGPRYQAGGGPYRTVGPSPLPSQ